MAEQVYRVITKEPLRFVPDTPEARVEQPVFQPGQLLTIADLENSGMRHCNTLIVNALWQNWIEELTPWQVRQARVSEGMKLWWQRRKREAAARTGGPSTSSGA